ncbi:hypothetical protein IV203_008591 [Nitzschia inconspicua]|uniref:Uncharacterized protein n=1 Tax=Nitzschia inconspicua TaxID=303405 RepID=A0A9K3PMA0_9STRA|nr:hypothetical protein IV203_008591 [Nitzschia inconspicua]
MVIALPLTSSTSRRHLVATAILLFFWVTVTFPWVEGFSVSVIKKATGQSLQDGFIPSVVLDDDLRKELNSQQPNEDAPPYNLDDGHLRPMTELQQQGPNDPCIKKIVPPGNHFEIYSLDDLFPHTQMSHIFNTNTSFRNGLRDAIRHDMMFGEGSLYGSMNDEQKDAELALQKPMIGLWKEWRVAPIADTPTLTVVKDQDDDNSIRMKATTAILRQHLGNNLFIVVPTGDEFMERIGSLCNSTQAPFHWTEVVGVAATQNRRMGDKTDHSWHQDYGCLEKNGGNNKHVFMGFPCQDNYHGTGVFPHLIPLKYEQWATQKDVTVGNGNLQKPMFYEGHPPEKHIVRPWYAPGKEIIVFRDVDVLHSTPDIQFRSSIMRFG